MSPTEQQFLRGFELGAWVSHDPGLLAGIQGSRDILKFEIARRGESDPSPISLGLRAAYLSAWGY